MSETQSVLDFLVGFFAHSFYNSFAEKALHIAKTTDEETLHSAYFSVCAGARQHYISVIDELMVDIAGEYNRRNHTNLTAARYEEELVRELLPKAMRANRARSSEIRNLSKRCVELLLQEGCRAARSDVAFVMSQQERKRSTEIEVHYRSFRMALSAALRAFRTELRGHLTDSRKHGTEVVSAEQVDSMRKMIISLAQENAHVRFENDRLRVMLGGQAASVPVATRPEPTLYNGQHAAEKRPVVGGEWANPQPPAPSQQPSYTAPTPSQPASYYAPPQPVQPPAPYTAPHPQYQPASYTTPSSYTAPAKITELNEQPPIEIGFSEGFDNYASLDHALDNYINNN